MTLYAGEPVRLSTTGKDWNGDDLTNLNTAAAWTEVWDATKTVVLARTDLVWNAAEAEWAFTWDTTGRDPGSYTARLVLVGDSDHLASWEFQKVRLNRNPVPL